MDPWLSPIRTFPAEAHIVVTSGFCGKSVGTGDGDGIRLLWLISRGHVQSLEGETSRRS